MEGVVTKYPRHYLPNIDVQCPPFLIIIRLYDDEKSSRAKREPLSFTAFALSLI